MTPKDENPMIWTPEQNSPKTKQVRGVIVSAFYSMEQEFIALTLDVSGRMIPISIHKTSFASMNGKPISECSKSEIDFEMGRTAELFMRRKGTKITLEVDESQLE